MGERVAPQSGSTIKSLLQISTGPCAALPSGSTVLALGPFSTVATSYPLLTHLPHLFLFHLQRMAPCPTAQKKIRASDGTISYVSIVPS